MIGAEAREEAIRGDRTENPPVPARPERICPNCGEALYESRCKLLCPNRQCGYYMSCSDFY
jgi:hypothetical protein